MKKRKEKTSSTQNKNNSLSSIQKVVLSFLLNSNVHGKLFSFRLFLFSIFQFVNPRIPRHARISHSQREV